MRRSLLSLPLALAGCAATVPIVSTAPPALTEPIIVRWSTHEGAPQDALHLADLALGGTLHCAQSATGRALCFGAITEHAPRKTLALSARVRQVSAGHEHACALLEDDTVRCIGGNRLAQLGTTPSFDPQGWTQPTIERVAQVAAGGEHTCALTRDGAVFCWGFAMYGSPGAPARRERCVGSSDECFCTATPTRIEGLPPAVSVHANGSSSCAITEARDGRRLFCWGYNQVGQLGDRSVKSVSRAVEAIEARGLRELALGSMHACALMGDGRVRCWGGARSRQLARDTDRWCTQPMLAGAPLECDPFAAEVPGLDRVAHITANDSTTCALREDHTVWCWGMRHGRELEPYGWRALDVHRVAAFDGADVVRVGSSTLCARGPRFDWTCVDGALTSRSPYERGSVAPRALRLQESAR